MPFNGLPVNTSARAVEWHGRIQGMAKGSFFRGSHENYVNKQFQEKYPLKEEAGFSGNIMKKKHQVRVDINGGYQQGREIIFLYSKEGEATVLLTEQAATISFYCEFDIESDNVNEWGVSVFLDAYRKIHLIHLFARGVTVKVDTIAVSHDGIPDYELDASFPDFPFILSTLEGTRFELSEKWRDERIYDKVSQWPLNASESNLLHCAVSGFLSAMTRRYPGDRLLDLWTAVNSYYSYQSVRYETAQAVFAGVERSALSSWQRAYGLDASGMTVTAMLDFGIFFEKHLFDNVLFLDLSLKALPLLGRIHPDDLDQMFKETASNFENHPGSTLIPDELYAIASSAHIPLHLFLIFYLPYFLRCELIHGSRSIPILCSYQDSRLAGYRVSCHYLFRFLDDKIPELFALSDTVSDNERELILCTLRARDKKKPFPLADDAARFGLPVYEYTKQETISQ